MNWRQPSADSNIQPSFTNAALQDMSPALAVKLKPVEVLAGMRQQWSAAGKKVVWTNGCFDLLHNGHVRNLQEARKQGDILIVGVNSDRSVKSNKGPSRPVQNELERAEMVAALGCVDFVAIFDEPTPIGALEMIRPDIHCKGSDYADGRKPMEERAVIERYGGMICFLKLHHGYSTTGLIERIRNEA